MKRVDELGISPWPWSCENDMVGDANHNSVCGNGWHPDSEDARLIAAAPDMYNALQFVFDHIAFQCFDGKNEVIEKAKELVRTALEKASGEEVYIG